MITDVSRIHSDLTTELQEISAIESPLERAALAGKHTYDRMKQALVLIASNQFVSEAEEVEVFKKTLPAIFAQYFYWSRVLDLQFRKKGKSPEMIRKLLMSERDEINRYYSANRSFLKYYFEELTFFGDRIFRREGLGFWPFDDFTPQFDAQIPKASEIIGAHMSFERYEILLAAEEYSSINRRAVEHVLPSAANQTNRYHLGKELDRLDHMEECGTPHKDIVTLGTSKSYLVEQIVALQLAELVYVNGQPASLAWLSEQAELLLHTDLKDFKSLDYANRSRKKEMTPLLTSMIKKYMARADRLNK